MKRLEPKAPRLMRNRAAFISAAPGLLLPVLVLSLAFWANLGTASAAEPQPDAAPQAPAVAPDPAPEARNTTPPQQSTPAPPTQVAPQAPDQPAAPAIPSITTQRQTSPKPKVESRPARVRRETPASRPERRAEPADPSRLVRVDAFLPGVQGNEDSPSHLVLLEARDLLALLMASGSLISVATRVWGGQLR
jgi:outer membrane biosynthesis protein TonB